MHDKHNAVSWQWLPIFALNPFMHPCDRIGCSEHIKPRLRWTLRRRRSAVAPAVVVIAVVVSHNLVYTVVHSCNKVVALSYYYNRSYWYSWTNRKQHRAPCSFTSGYVNVSVRRWTFPWTYPPRHFPHQNRPSWAYSPFRRNWDISPLLK